MPTTTHKKTSVVLARYYRNWCLNWFLGYIQHWNLWTHSQKCAKITQWSNVVFNMAHVAVILCQVLTVDGMLQWIEFKSWINFVIKFFHWMHKTPLWTWSYEVRAQKTGHSQYLKRYCSCTLHQHHSRTRHTCKFWRN